MSMIMDNKPEYTGAHREGVQYGDIAYENMECFCERCGYVVIYDGLEDDGHSAWIHMGMDGDYGNRVEAEFDMAKKLAKRLYGKCNPDLFAGYGLPELAPTETISEEMIINTWSDFLIRYAHNLEMQDWTS